ncbi:hypothetical protein [Actinoplanes auranticolor]|uniref:Uncharacterized protein n=1 Tax=Actinoplanes auranticolor TaxID=47988 RepID=A0A919S849_9ACTN|nr:hypothetical protein [Actinoplanes auranticolor]GIM65996.1 hypothetical protein Aau02nite_21180 [Actinoplanes auranticolor]
MSDAYPVELPPGDYRVRDRRLLAPGQPGTGADRAERKRRKAEAKALRRTESRRAEDRLRWGDRLPDDRCARPPGGPSAAMNALWAAGSAHGEDGYRQFFADLRSAFPQLVR